MTCSLIGVIGFALVLVAFRNIRLPEPVLITIPVRETFEPR